MRQNSDLFGHPTGLFVLFTTELWERFSYFSLRAIFVLYLTDKVHQQGGGLNWSVTDALSLYGTFLGLIFLTPLLGGFVADCYIGKRKAIIYGGLGTAFGHFLLAIPHDLITGYEILLLYTGIAFIVIGNGFFKPNIITMVGDLYQQGDKRRDNGFTIFYVGINIGAALSGVLVAFAYTYFSYIETINQVEIVVYNWQAGFLLSGIGMLLSVLIQYLFAQKHLGQIGIEPINKISKKTPKKHISLTSIEKDRIKVILIFGVFTAIFWTGFEQSGGLLNIFTNDYTDRMLGDFEIPTTWFLSLNPIFIIILSPIMIIIWSKLDNKEPTAPIKMVIGFILMALGFIVMMIAVWQMEKGQTQKASMIWLILTYLLHTVGELALSPIGFSITTKLSPVRFASFMIGSWFLFLAIANKLAGLIGGLVGDSTEENILYNIISIFSGITITLILSAIILYIISDKLIEWMHDSKIHTKKARKDKIDINAHTNNIQKNISRA